MAILLNDNGGIFSSYYSKAESFTIYFDQALLSKNDKGGLNLYANVTSSVGIKMKVDEKWIDIPKDKYPMKINFTFATETKEKEILYATQALMRFVEQSKIELPAKLSGEIDIAPASPDILAFASTGEGDLNRLGVKFFGLNVFTGEFTLGDAPKSSGGGKGYGGGGGQKQVEIIADRVAYIKSLGEIKNAADLLEGFMAINTISKEVGVDQGMTFNDFIKTILR
ncbi:hypothetical protein [Chamaesiphon sp.]|uniref:hypothetical protein n=1 Tax=Chamaesiphon sp. TaxID=2814140 RepID=UPI003593493F